jgi:hypothetical protein
MFSFKLPTELVRIGLTKLFSAVVIQCDTHCIIMVRMAGSHLWVLKLMCIVETVL